MMAALYQTRRLWENEVQKQSRHSALYFVFFQYLVWDRGINMEALHSEHPAYKRSTYGRMSKHHMMMSHHDVIIDDINAAFLEIIISTLHFPNTFNYVSTAFHKSCHNSLM
jgi:hypothetical protein